MRHFRYYFPLILWAGIIFFLSSLPGSTYPSLPYLDKVAHFFEYFILGYFLVRFIFNFDLSLTLPGVFLTSIILGSSFGFLDEIHQIFVPLRSCDFFDWLTDILGISAGILIFLKTSSESKKPKMLLHLCCASCGVYVANLLKEKFRLILYFYNPNIHPEEEYKRRLKDVKKLAQGMNLPLIIGEYEVEEWFKQIKGLEEEPEGGERCSICFRIRLEKSAQLAKKLNCSYLATSLTVGPQKNASVINQIGRQVAQKYGIIFYEADFKKKEGFKKSVILSKKWGFYRQNYCGCIFSRRENNNLKI